MRIQFKTLVATIILLSASLTTAAAPVDNQIFQFAANGHLYAWIDDSLTWPNSNTAAQQFSAAYNGNALEDWYLATITSQDENDFLAETVLGLPESFTGRWGDKRAWIGLFNEHGANNFEWVTGETTSYTNWFPGEPNNSTGTVGTLGRYANGQWNDEFTNSNNSGFGLLAYLVEHNDPAIVPIPAAIWLFGSGIVGLIAFSKKRGKLA